jgi:hypothetical protein
MRFFFIILNVDNYFFIFWIRLFDLNFNLHLLCRLDKYRGFLNWFHCLINRLWRLFSFVRGRLFLTIQINHLFFSLFHPLVCSSFFDHNLAASLVVYQHIVNPNIDVGLVDLAFTDGTVPETSSAMGAYQCLKADAAEMFAVSTSNRNLDPLSGVGTHETHFVLGNLHIRIVLLEDLKGVFPLYTMLSKSQSF